MDTWEYCLTRLFFHSAPVWCNDLTSHLRHSTHHSTSSSPTSGNCISDLSTSVFLKKIKISPLSHFLSTLICTHLGFSRTDISGIDPACLAFSSHFHFVSAHLHIIHQCNFLFVFTTQVFKNKLSLSCSTFISTINQLHSILLFIVTSSHTISLF